MSCCPPGVCACPTQAGFLWFIRNIMGIPQANLADDSQVITWVYCRAVNNVLQLIQQYAPWEYVPAVYNLAADYLINVAPDVGGSTYFQDLRASFNILKFTGGVVSSASDEGTSVSVNVIDNLNNLTVGDLQNLKTPYGQAYLAVAQEYGTVWGIS